MQSSSHTRAASVSLLRLLIPINKSKNNIILLLLLLFCIMLLIMKFRNAESPQAQISPAAVSILTPNYVTADNPFPTTNPNNDVDNFPDYSERSSLRRSSGFESSSLLHAFEQAGISNRARRSNSTDSISSIVSTNSINSLTSSHSSLTSSTESEPPSPAMASDPTQNKKGWRSSLGKLDLAAATAAAATATASAAAATSAHGIFLKSKSNSRLSTIIESDHDHDDVASLSSSHGSQSFINNNNVPSTPRSNNNSPNSINNRRNSFNQTPPPPPPQQQQLQQSQQPLLSPLSQQSMSSPTENDNNFMACTLRVTLRDTGIGMTPEEQARIFKRFSQANNRTSRVCLSLLFLSFFSYHESLIC